jgi:ribosome-associated translation inhibitor RaiA
MDDVTELGGNVELTGFRDLDSSMMLTVKKTIGTYLKHFSNKCIKLESVKIRMKRVHEQERSEKYEMHATLLDNGKLHTATVTERNLFTALDAALKKLENAISR